MPSFSHACHTRRKILLPCTQPMVDSPSMLHLTLYSLHLYERNLIVFKNYFMISISNMLPFSLDGRLSCDFQGSLPCSLFLAVKITIFALALIYAYQNRLLTLNETVE